MNSRSGSSDPQKRSGHGGRQGPQVIAPETSKILGFTVHDSEWEMRIRSYLRHNPGSPALAIAQHLWPDFLSFPADRRSSTWFWVKGRLEELEERGIVQCREHESGVALWSLVR